MDIREYISSGILELYVLGAASDQERQEVECMSHIYPEIETELRQLQLVVEKKVSSSALAPPAALKGKILAAIENVPQETVGGKTAEPSGTSEPSERGAKVVQMKVPGLYKFAAAASVALLIGLVAVLLNSQQSIKQLQADLTGEKAASEQLAERFSETESALAQKDRLNNILIASATNEVLLKGTDNSPESAVRVYWNTESSEVLMKVDQLPEPPSGKQYQLWAIVDGTPQDMGVFELDAASDSLQLIPVSVSGAAAFAITLEDEGGKPSPDLSQLYVIGNV